MGSSASRQVLAYLEAHGEGRVNEVAQALGVDPTTVRRAFRRLNQMGLVERVWGGARLFEAVRYVGEAGRNHEIRRKVKHALAQRAVLLVEPGMRIALSGGSTCTHLARLLRGKPLLIHTNAVNIAVELFSYPKTRVFLVPGELNLFSYEVVGPEAVAHVERLPEVDIFFAGASVVTPKGFFMRDQPEAEVARAFTKKARRVYVLADSSKWREEAPPLQRGFFAALEEVTEWIREG